MRVLELFSGCGGGLLASIILGHEPVCAVELDPYCCQVLRERAAEGWFPGLHVFEGDVRVFNASDWKGKVDCIHAGFPCPPFSVAGKRLGAMDERNMWPSTARVIGEIHPRLVFLENVGGFVSSGYGWTVLSDLSRLGYDARWTCVAADQVGAPHIRDRWWLMANTKHTGRERCGIIEIKNGRKTDDAPSGCEDVANATSIHAQRFFNGQREVKSGGSGWWKTEPDVGRVANGVASRVDRLKALGNAQVPLQAAIAFKILMGDK